MDPLLLLDCLDLVLLILCTCSRTRCCPDLNCFTDGRASDVSSTFPMEMADFSGSRLVIFCKLSGLLDYIQRRLVLEASQLRSIGAV